MKTAIENKTELRDEMTGKMIIELNYDRMKHPDRLYLERALVNTLNHVSAERGIKMVVDIVG